MESLFDDIISGDSKAPESLKTFIESQANQKFSFPELNNDNKRQQLWKALFTLANSTKDKTVLANCFTAIRIISREKVGLNELITDELLNLIAEHSGLNDPNYSFDGDNLTVAVESQKCLCNLVYNSPVAAGLCCKNGILEKLTTRIKPNENNETPNKIKFFDVKLIFLLTALCTEIRGKAKDDMDANASLIKMLEKVLKRAALHPPEPEKIFLDDEMVELTCEILKALFNLTLYSYGNHNDKTENEQCGALVNLLRMFLLMPAETKKKTLIVQNDVINLLTNMPSQSYILLTLPIQPDHNISSKYRFEGLNMTAFYEILEFLRSKLTDEKGKAKQYESLTPVMTVLFKSANSNRSIRKYFRSQILPPLKDVHNRPEQGSTLRNHLCRLLTTPITSLRDLVAEFLFLLCKMKVSRMIKYTGYGNAAGLFAQRGLLGGKSDEGEAYYSSESEDSETEEYAEYKHGINPVLGCYEAPHPNAMADMTEEQKEYEAMKLVELMDNLTRCGAIKPCRVGADGKPHPIEHVLQLREGMKKHPSDDSDSD